MKPRFYPLQLVVSLLALAGMSSVQAVTYNFSGQTAGGGTYDWSTGTGWSATPTSASDTTLNFYQGTTVLSPNTGTYTLDNDIPGDFSLNRLEFGGFVNGTNMTVNITGNSLSFVNNGLVGPAIDLLSSSFGGSTMAYNVQSDVHFEDDTTVVASVSSTNLLSTFTLSGNITGDGNLIVASRTSGGADRNLRLNGATNNSRLFSGDIIVNNGSLTFNSGAAAGFGFYTLGDLEVNDGLLNITGTNAVLSVLSFSGTGGAISGGTGNAIFVNEATSTPTSFAGTLGNTSIRYLGAGHLTVDTLGSAPSRVFGVGTLSTPGAATGTIGPDVIGAQGTFEVTGTNGNVLGDATNTLFAYGGALRFAPTGSGQDVEVNGQRGNSQLIVNARTSIELDKGDNDSLAVSIGQSRTDAVIVRDSGPGTIVIKPASGLANLGTASGETLRILGGNSSAVPALQNGIVAGWTVGQDTDGTGDFLTYNGTGLSSDVGYQVATYTATDTLAGTGATSLVHITDSGSVSANSQSLFALRNDGTVTINSGQTLTMEQNNAGVILNGGTITGGTLGFGFNNTHFRSYTIFAGLEGGTISSAITTVSRGQTFTDTGHVVLTKFGEGTLTLTGTVSLTGAVPGQFSINEGAVRFNANMSNLATTGPTLLLNGGVLETSGTFNRALTAAGTATNGVNLGLGTFSPGGGFSAGGGDLSVNLGGSAATLTWNTTNFVRDYGQLMFGSLTADAVVDFQNGLELGANSAAYFRQIDVKDNVNSSDDVALMSGLIADTSGSEGLHGLQKTGNGTLALGANNTYTGITAISSGTLQLGFVGTVNSQSYDGSTGTVAGDVHNYGTLAFQRTNAHTFAGEISGTGDVVHTGSGTTALTAANTYGGGTVVNAGTLLVNNTEGSGLGSGNVTVDGGTLGGSGGFTGDVLVNAGGTLSPGNSIESLGTGSIAFDGGTFEFELNTTTVNADLVYGDAGSSLTLTGGALLSLSDLGSGDVLTLGTKFTLISYDGAWNNGTFTGYADDSIFSFANNTWQIDYNDTTAGLNFASEANLNGTSFVTMTVVVPEPTTSLLLGLGLATALFGFRRRR